MGNELVVTIRNETEGLISYHMNGAIMASWFPRTDKYYFNWELIQKCAADDGNLNQYMAKLLLEVRRQHLNLEVSKCKTI